jgi:hypothetical protein
MHPLALERFEEARRVFFIIEGCLKADAVLSAGGAVFSCPSVTLWNAPERELKKFADHYLRGKQVVIVADADWYSNPRVVEQAMFCRSTLQQYIVEDVHVAAPPVELFRRTKGTENEIKGVDDFLGAGYGLDDLEVIERRPRHGLAEWVAKRSRRRDQAVRDSKVLQAMALHADKNGQIRASYRKIARVMNVHHSDVQRALKDLAKWGAIDMDGDPSVRVMGWLARNYYSEALDWDNQPIITIAPELRAEECTYSLGELPVP